MNQQASRIHTGSLLQVLLSALGLAACAVGAGFMLVSGVLLATSGNQLFREQVGILISLAWTLLFLAGAALPSLIVASQRIAGRSSDGEVDPAAKSHRLRNASLALLLWPAVLAAGRALSGQGELAWFLLPPLQIAAVVLPLWWLVEVARDRLPAFSAQRTWGVINFSLFFSTPLVILVEVLLFVVALAGLVVVISASPELQQTFDALSRRILNSMGNPQALLRIYRPLLSQPWVIFALLAGLSGIVPLVEELIKPLAVWVLGGRRLSPAEGFVAGALSGAGFAVLETLFSLTNPLADGWLSLAIGRAGTGLLHITTAALMGYGLTYAWQSGRYLRLGAIYFGAVFVHGLWNALSVTGAIADLTAGESPVVSLLVQIGRLAPYGLGILAVFLFILLLGVNFLLRGRTPITSPAHAG